MCVVCVCVQALNMAQSPELRLALHYLGEPQNVTERRPKAKMERCWLVWAVQVPSTTPWMTNTKRLWHTSERSVTTDPSIPLSFHVCILMYVCVCV